MPSDIVETYRSSMAGLTGREAKAWRSYWHYAAKQWLIFNSLTADTAGDPPSHVDYVNRQRVVIAECVVPYIYFFFIDAHGNTRWCRRDMERLYRITKPMKPKPKPE